MTVDLTVISEALIPGIVATTGGVIFLVGRERVFKSIVEAHDHFWRQNLSAEVGSFSHLFLRALIIILGVGMLLSGAMLLFRVVSPLAST